MSQQVVTSLDALAEEWEELSLRVRSSVFHSAGYFRAWSAFAPEGMRYVTARRDGQLVGVLPVVVRRSTIRAAANVHSPSYAPVCLDREAVLEVAEGVGALRPLRVVVDGLVEAPDTVAALREGLRSALPVQQEVVSLQSPYVDVDGDLETFRAQHQSLQRRIGKKLRRAQRAWEVELGVEHGPRGAEIFLTEGLPVEAMGWKAAEHTAIVSSPRTLAFYTHVAQWAAEQGTLRLFSCRFDGRLVAFTLGVQDGDRLALLKRGYDEAVAELAPGFLVDQHTLEHGFTQPHLRRIDLLGGPNPYKLEIASGCAERVTVSGWARTAPAQALMRAAAVRGAATRQLKAHAPERVVPALRKVRGWALSSAAGR